MPCATLCDMMMIAVISSPAVCDHGDGPTAFVVSSGNKLYAVDAAKGEKRWDFATQGSLVSSPVFSADCKTAFVGSVDNNLYAVSAVDGTEKWKFATVGAVVSSPSLSPQGDTVIVGSRDNLLRL